MLVATEKGLSAWLSQLLIDRALVAPVSGVNGLVLFEQVTSADAVLVRFSNAALPPKDLFFPRSEALLSVVNRDGKTTLVPASVERETVVFGVRPCDARGISLLDKPFLAAPADTLYQARREKTALIGLACTAPCPECFCTSAGTGPADSSDVDVMVTPIRELFGVQPITEKGRKLMSGALLRETKESSPPPPAVQPVNTKGVGEALRKAFSNAYWDRLADRCIHCNACAYVCPTCYCFDIRDYASAGKIERVRSWESCQSAQFTRAAGGHNPRPGKGARLRQRFAHKLLYFPDIFGALKCTGCGRCVRNCPVNIDIREMISDVQKLAGK